MIDYIKGFLADAFLVSIVAASLVIMACIAAMLDWILSIWRASVPDDQPAKADEKHAASVDHFPMGWITFLIALIGVCGVAAIIAGA